MSSKGLGPLCSIVPLLALVSSYHYSNGICRHCKKVLASSSYHLLVQTLSSEQFSQSALNKHKGKVLVYTNRKCRGVTLHLMSGFQETSVVIEATFNVVERQIAERRSFSVTFRRSPRALHARRILQKARCPCHCTSWTSFRD
jgi:hypothetical protein